MDPTALWITLFIVSHCHKTKLMAEINANTRQGNPHNKPKRLVKKSTRVDLTPMVDLGFLLITFFVFTTNLSRANAMHLIMPKDGNELPVKESGAMTILIGDHHALFYYFGQLDPSKVNAKIKATSFKAIRELIAEKKGATPMGDLMYIIKGDKKARYKDIVDLLDEMLICDIPEGHYAEAELNGTELKVMNGR
jgi:biopolymer transport protein ExbD